MSDFEEELETRQYSLKDFHIIKSFFRYLKPYRVKFILLLLADAIATICFLMEPVVASEIITFLSKPSEFNENAVKIICGLCLLDVLFYMSGSIMAYFINMSLKKMGQKVIYDIRNELFSHVLSLSQAQLKSLKIGSYVTRITNDTQNLSTLFSDVLPSLLRSVFSLLIIIFTVFIKEGYYGFIFLAFLPIVFLVAYLFRRKAKVYYRQEKKAVSEMNSFLSETFQGIKVIKTYDREDKKVKEFDKCNEKIKGSFLKSQNLFSFFYPIMYLFQMCCILIVLGFGVPATVSGSLSLGDLQLMYSYSYQFFSPIQTIAQLLNNLQSILSSAERTQVIMEMKPEIESDNSSISVKSFKGKIEFRHVYFAYVKDEYVLKDVSFVINPGQTAAFVGATGAGKSTIISLISRTYECNKGEILIDDINIRDYTLNCLRKNIGVMLQDVFLFSGTIADNISLGEKSVTEEDIEKGAKEVGADAFIEKLPKRYQETVTERGDNYSAGQKQLISFARTLVYKPSLVLLDEATANIDTETENIIQSSLSRMRNIGTMVIVAHRLSTIKTADIIFVISHGHLIEEGTHQELLKLKGNYYNLYRLQNMEKSIGYQSEVK
ncbi:MAG: ABC transporter ATP-binding protein [Bacilli bacterium]